METLEKTINYMAYEMPIMRYYDNSNPATPGAIQKRTDIIQNKDNLYICSEKHDGDLGLFVHYNQNSNLIRSRSISKVTGEYGDMTVKLPHLVEEMNMWPDNTVVVAEIWWGSYGTNANSVGTILRCLPDKAVERQKEHKLVASMFDVLMIDGQDLMNTPYESRLLDYLPQLETPLYFSTTQVFMEDFAEAADQIIAAGGEGVVIQRKDNPYMPGTRTAWKTLKLKQKLDSEEYLVIGTLNPNRIYYGDCIETWPYWEGIYEDGSSVLINHEPTNIDRETNLTWTPVTKPYYHGWKNGITIYIPSTAAECDVTSGLTDEDREWLASPEIPELIAKHQLYAEVKAMSINDKGGLRHPALVKLRLVEEGAHEE